MKPKKWIQKGLQFITTMFILSILVFYMGRLAPGDPLRAYYGDGLQRMSTEKQEQARNRLGLEEPIYHQYMIWIEKAIEGDFGKSFKYKEDVTEVISDVYMNTLILGGTGFILTFGFALLLGIYCIFHENGLADRVLCKIGTVTSSIPPFWISLLLIFIFSVSLRILPSSGAYKIGQKTNLFSRAQHLILPLSVLILSHLWYFAYIARNKLSEEIRQEYVRISKSKGLSKRKIVYGHCIRNIMPTYVSMMAISISHILGGTYVIETVFSYPGLGLLSFESAKYHDYNMLMVLTLITGAVVVISNMLAQGINKKLDPRLRDDRGEITWF